MTLNDSSFKTKLYNILKDLNKIEPSEVTLQRCIDDKLNASYEQYEWTIKNIYNYVLTRSNVKVIKALSKIRDKKEKENGSKSD